MTPNPWIEWSKQAPTEKDLPIHCAMYGDRLGAIWDNILPKRYEIWRPYVCDIPKAPEVKNMKLDLEIKVVPYRLTREELQYHPNYWSDSSIVFSTKEDGEIEAVNTGGYIEKIVMIRGVAYRSHPYWRPHKGYRPVTPFNIEELRNPKPQPDANGWWRIEDKEPFYGQFIEFELTKEAFDTYVLNKEGWRFTVEGISVGRFFEGIIYNLLGATFLKGELSRWKPLDMSGPVEEK